MNWSCMRKLLVLLLLLPQFGHAAPQLLTYDYVRFYGATDPRVLYACESTTACTRSTMVPNTSWTLQYNAYGTSMFGVLRDFASVDMTGDASLGGFPSFASIGSRSGYRDTYTISGGTGSGIAKFRFAVTGSTWYAPGASAGSLFQYIPVVNGSEAWSSQLNFGVDANGNATVAIPFTFDQPFEGEIYLYALAQVFRFDQATSAQADFSHTAILSSIDVVDANGTPVDFSLQAASGTAYPLAAQVPEPSTPLLASIAFVGLALSRSVGRAKSISRRAQATAFRPALSWHGHRPACRSCARRGCA